MRLLAVEDRLAADPEGAERDRLARHLQALARAARHSLDKGLPPSDAQRLLALIAALEAGQSVVAQVWAHLQEPRR